jgi:hypothetical protein
MFMATDTTLGPAGTKAPSSEEVRAALDQVLASPEFRSSQRAHDFLQYVVEATLNGAASNLKERTIGIDVFGRDASFEPSDDSTVRVKAGDVRKRLAVYYAGPQGSRERVVIDLPLGSYVPQFRYRDVENRTLPSSDNAGGLAEPTTSPAPKGGSLFFRPRRALLVGVVVIVSIVGAALYSHYSVSSISSPLAQFWAPVFQNSSPALILVAPVPIYSRQKPLAQGPLQGKDFLEVLDQFVAVGDLKAEARIAEFMDRARHPARVKIGNNVAFDDLRQSPTVLVGFSYNQWKDLNQGMRFTIDPDNEMFFGITENGAPSKWRIALHPSDPKLDEDYAIVSRIFHRDTGQVLVQVSGISHYGTEAAADLITDAGLFQQALRNAPDDWQKMNIQIVLHVRVISGGPTAPSVVATQFW